MGDRDERREATSILSARRRGRKTNGSGGGNVRSVWRTRSFLAETDAMGIRTLLQGDLLVGAEKFHGDLPETEKTAIGGTVGVVHVDRQGYVARLLAVRVRHYGL